MLNDRDWIKKVINARDDEIVIPLYVQIYGTKYPLLKLDEIKKRFSPSAFKIGYGTADGWFMKNAFPTQRINEFDLIESFSEYDSENEINIRYTVFESGDVDVVEGDTLGEEIHKYFDLLFNNVKERVDTYFRSLIEADTVPVIPKETVKEEVQTHIPVVDKYDDTEDLPYPSIDDKYDEYTSVEESDSDPLEDLRREVQEYTQDENNNSYDDYLNEGSTTEDEDTEDTTIEQDDDYSTDFDIF